jgi:tetratricopeptide (TPR) repeat protein
VYLRLSYYYSQAGRFSDAVSVLEKLAAFQPANTDFLNYLAIAYEQNNQVAKAEKTLRKVLEIDTASHEPHFQLATLYDRMGKFEMAEKELKTAIQIKPDYHIALNYLGYSYADRNVKLDEAEALINDAVGLDPENPAYLDSMGWLYYRQGKLQKATDFLREASRRTRDALIFDHLGDVENAKGESVEAALAWDEATRIDPRDKRIRGKLAKVLKKMSPNKKIDVFFKRALAQFGDIHAVNSLVEISLCDTSPCFKSKAQFGFVTNEGMRVEIPGPLSGPVMLLTKDKGKPARYGAIHPQFQTAEVYATGAFTRIEQLLSAEVFRTANLADLMNGARQSGRNIVAEGGGLRFTFDGQSGDFRRVEWLSAARPDAIEADGHGAPLPEGLTWKDGKTGVTLGVDFIKPVVSTLSDTADSQPKDE